MAKRPLGIRNNNPGNIEWGSPWQGLKEKTAQSGRFCEFKSPVWGVRAICVLLINYYDKHKLDTVRKVISRWAPTHENDTGAYASHVAKQMGVHPNKKLNLHEYDTLRGLVCGIIRHENGNGPLDTESTWYSEAVIDEALRRAGVVPRTRTVGKTPVTRETVGATTAAGIGAAQIMDAVGQLQDAVNTTQDAFSAGSYVQIALGVLAICVAGYIAWAQMRKHKEGVIE